MSKRHRAGETQHTCVTCDPNTDVEHLRSSYRVAEATARSLRDRAQAAEGEIRMLELQLREKKMQYERDTSAAAQQESTMVQLQSSIAATPGRGWPPQAYLPLAERATLTAAAAGVHRGGGANPGHRRPSGAGAARADL